MCGRFALNASLDDLRSLLPTPLPPWLEAHYAPRPEVRPGEPVLVQRQEHGRLEPALVLWGLVPEWSRDPLGHRRPINARSETVAEKPSFRGAWRHRRCLIPADGFHEWQRKADGRRQPWLFRRRDRRPFWLGGLWERWIGADGGELETCVILTTAPNDLLARVHDRMPVTIPEGLEEAWLAPCDGPALRALEPLLAPWDPAGWEAIRPEPTAPRLSAAQPLPASR
jgi:putative SOS response-associated peptidase YedK